MARERSPHYPNASLPDALKRVRKIFDKDRQAPLGRDVIAKHIGYGGPSGAADKMISTLRQYGLIDKAPIKGEFKVSQLAMDIFHPLDVQQKRRALHTAAYSPEVFRSIRERFGPGVVPSEEAAKSHLIRLEYFDRAIGPIISAYAETCQFLEREGASEIISPSDDDEEESAGDNQEPAGEDIAARLERARERILNASHHPPPTGGFTQRVLTKGLLSKGSTFEIIVSGQIGQKEIEMLIRKLEIDKEILADPDDHSDIA